MENSKEYTRLAKEGKFDELPDTCEFSEAVELEVGDDELSREFRKITGKFKGNYMDIHCIGWKYIFQNDLLWRGRNYFKSKH